MDKQQSSGMARINSAHWFFVGSSGFFVSTLNYEIPSLMAVSGLLLLSTVFTLGMMWFWLKSNWVLLCLNLLLTVGVLKDQGNFLQHFSLVLVFYSLYLWSLRTYLLGLLTDSDMDLIAKPMRPR